MVDYSKYIYALYWFEVNPPIIGVAITLKKHWEKHHCVKDYLSKKQVAELDALGLDNIAEADYLADPDLTKEEVQDLLDSKGLSRDQSFTDWLDELNRKQLERDS